MHSGFHKNMLNCIDKNIKTTGLTVAMRLSCKFALKMARGATQHTFKSPPFHPKSKQFIPACRRAHRPGGCTGKVGYSSILFHPSRRWPISIIRPWTCQTPILATIRAAGISSNRPTTTAAAAQTNSVAALTFANFRTTSKLLERIVRGWMLLWRAAHINPLSGFLWNQNIKLNENPHSNSFSEEEEEH